MHITRYLLARSDRLSDSNGNDCMIYQRCRPTDCIDMNNVTWDEDDGYQYKNIKTNDNLLDEIGSGNVNNDDINGHELLMFRKDLNKLEQFDNSAKNIVNGIANGYEIYSFPTATAMSWKHIFNCSDKSVVVGGI